MTDEPIATPTSSVKRAGRPPLPNCDRHKRRVIFVRDEPWAWLRQQAESRGMSVGRWLENLYERSRHGRDSGQG